MVRPGSTEPPCGLLEARAKHGACGLYVESFNEAWSETPNTDRALGEMVARHTADTHLHLIEAYCELQHATNRPHVGDALAALSATFVASFLARRLEWRGHHYGLAADNTLAYYGEGET